MMDSFHAAERFNNFSVGILPCFGFPLMDLKQQRLLALQYTNGKVRY
jgi:hypothetical protein